MTDKQKQMIRDACKGIPIAIASWGVLYSPGNGWSARGDGGCCPMGAVLVKHNPGADGPDVSLPGLAAAALDANPLHVRHFIDGFDGREYTGYIGHDVDGRSWYDFGRQLCRELHGGGVN